MPDDRCSLDKVQFKRGQVDAYESLCLRFIRGIVLVTWPKFLHGDIEVLKQPSHWYVIELGSAVLAHSEPHEFL